jgi:DNA repair ATPase RecN
MRTQLQSISANSGFLEHCPVEFAAGLTCIIGARGTCKSTLIESIRFAFDSDRARVAALIGEERSDHTSPTFGLIRHTLRAGSIRAVVVQIGGSSPTTYTLEREVGSETRLFVDGVREYAQRDMLHGIEIFSQGDLQRIAEDNNHTMRLDLIDRPNKRRVIDLMQQRNQLAEDLRQLGPQVQSVRTRVSALQYEANQLGAVESSLRRAREDCPPPTPELEAERVAYEQRQRILEEVRQLEASRATISGRLSEIRSPARNIAEAVARLRADSSVDLDEVSISLDAVENAVENLLAAATQIDTASFQPQVDELVLRFEEKSERYYQLRQEEQAVNESLKQQQVLQRQIEHLTRQARALDVARAEEKQLLERRKGFRAAITQIDDELYDLRVAEVDAINAEHRETVQLALGSSFGSREYAQRLSALLTGSRIRAQEDVAEAIVERLSPGALIDLVEAGNAQRLADVLNRDLGQMSRVLTHLADHEGLYDLELAPPSTRLDITLYDRGQPKPVETLSKGQRATALLPIILRPLPYPLIFDQPEDDLDNKFIFGSLVKTIRTLRQERQVIFVTHNANIPVLGEADEVIVMRMTSPEKAAPPLVGTIDERKQEILDLLEGGADAFAKRERRYHDLLPSDAETDTDA